MIEIIDVNYSMLSEKKSGELFGLRKMVFKDRLNWAVKCYNDMEFDEYDNDHTTYLLGIYNNTVIFSTRFIDMKNNNMITGTFHSFFKNIKIPDGKYFDASRLFIDKSRSREMDLKKYPLSSMLFLGMINFARKSFYDGIYAIVSHSMFIIFKRSGWHIEIVDKGLSEKKEVVYLIFMPVDDGNQQNLINNISKKNLSTRNFYNLPLCFSLRKDRPDNLQLST